MNIVMLSCEDVSATHAGAVHTIEVAKSFSELGHHVLLISPGRVSKQPFQHHSCPMRLGPVATTWRAFSCLEKINSFKPDLIYERQLISGGFGSYLSKKLDIGYVLEVNSPHRHEYLHRFGWMKYIDFLLMRLEKYQFCQAQLVVTTHKSLVPSYYKNNAFVGPWAVSDQIGESSELIWPQFKDKKIILMAGSFHQWHGTQYIESMLNNISSDDWIAVFVGGGDRRKNMIKHLKEKISHIFDGGDLNKKEMSRAYSQAHVLLAPFDCPLPDFPFYYSPFKILEALAHALPVVTHDDENIKLLLDDAWCGQTLSRQDSFEKWGQALGEILKRDKVDHLKGIDYAQRHSWKKHVQKILEMC